MRGALPSATLGPEVSVATEGVDKTFDFSVDLRFTFPFSPLLVIHLRFHQAKAVAFAHQAKAVTFHFVKSFLVETYIFFCGVGKFY